MADVVVGTGAIADLGTPAGTERWAVSAAGAAREVTLNYTIWNGRTTAGYVAHDFGVGITPPASIYGRILPISMGAGTAHPALLAQAVNTNDERIYLLNNAWPATGAFSGNFTYNKTGAAATRYLQTAGQHVWGRAAVGTAGNTISWTDGMTLDASGNLFVGATNLLPGCFFGPDGSSGQGNNAGASGFAFKIFYRSGAGIGSITQSGTTGVAYNTLSDGRLKNDIVDAGDAGEVIDAIRVRSFSWKIASDEQTPFGFVAQELAQVAPYAVKVGDAGAVDDNGVPADPKTFDAWGNDPSKLVPLLVKEIQSLRARLDAAGIA